MSEQYLLNIGFFLIGVVVLVQDRKSGFHVSVSFRFLCCNPCFFCLLHIDCVRLVHVVLLRISKKRVGVALARLPHIAERQAVARQCHDGNAGRVLRFARRSRRNPRTRSGYRTPCLSSSRTLLCTRSALSWSLSPFLPARSIESVLQGIEEHPPHSPWKAFARVSRITCTPSSVATSSGSSPS